MKALLMALMFISACATIEAAEPKQDDEMVLIRAQKARRSCIARAMSICNDERFYSSCLPILVEACNAQFSIERNR